MSENAIGAILIPRGELTLLRLHYVSVDRLLQCIFSNGVRLQVYVVFCAGDSTLVDSRGKGCIYRTVSHKTSKA